MKLFKKCIAEFIGAYGIVFAGCSAIMVNQLTNGLVTHTGIAITFGLIVMTGIYTTGHISGAHFNPAVTIAFSLTRHFPVKQIVPYIAAQCLGAVSASLIHWIALKPVIAKMAPNVMLNYGVTLPIDGAFSTALIWEILLTFFLMFVIMAVATDYRAVGEMAGIAIGATVCLGALFGGPISGASMNPARSFGPALISGEWEHFAAYVIGPVIGASLGAFVYKFIRCEQEQDPQVKGCC